jgi:hypothetical protein
LRRARAELTKKLWINHAEEESMGRRKARTTQTLAALPAIIETAEEAEIERAVRGWRVAHEKWFSSEGSYEFFYAGYLEWLEIGDPIYVAAVVRAATLGHPAADHAIRRFFRLAAETRRVQLFSSVLAYMATAVERAPLPIGCASQSSQAVNNFMRDMGITIYIGRVREHWPKVPLLHGQHSAAAIVGRVFELSARHARRIFRANAEDRAAVRLAVLMLGFTASAAERGFRQLARGVQTEPLRLVW